MVDDYTHMLAGDSLIAGRRCAKVVMIPKPEAAVVWGKVILWVDARDLLMLRAEYYDEYGELSSTMVAGDVRMLGGRLLPARMEMVPADKPGQRTVIQYKAITFDKPIPEGFFTTQNMMRVR